LLKAAEGREDLLAFMLYRVVIDHVDFSKDGTLALAWLAMVDKDSGYVQPAEPGLVIARMQNAADEQWQFTFQADKEFSSALDAVPEKMLSAADKELYKPGKQPESKGTVYRGYHLPWENGQTVRLSGSIGHVFTYKTCPTTCLYAFDFANGTMFPVHAAKGGTVKYYNWDGPNGNTTETNFIVLEDTSTTPTTYQVYAHLAYNTIPVQFRKVGARVAQGDFIGNADDTGASSGHHLHFHVHTNPSSWWGTSVDIVFDEVTINGGRPRQCSEAAAFPQYGNQCMEGDRYVSRNRDTIAPTGGISDPAAYTTVTAPVLNVTGWAKDDGGVKDVQLMYSTNGKWKPVGDLQKSTSFTVPFDMCAAKVPDGTFFLSLTVTDLAGHVAEEQGLTELKKDYKCPPEPPVCVPAANQVALYSENAYQGKCQLLEIGKYGDMSRLDQVGNDQARGIQVGADVTALAYTKANFKGEMEMFQNGDPNLSDNTVGAANISSIKVVKRIVPPIPPTIKLPEVVNTETELKITWTTEEGAQTRATLSGPEGYANSLDWQDGGKWEVGKLAKVGDYTLEVEAKNLAGSTSVTQTFSVVLAPQPPVTRMLQLPEVSNSNALMLQWEVQDEGAGIDHFELQWSKGSGDWQDYEAPLNADTRELLFWGTPSKKMAFRIRAVDVQGVAEAFPQNEETSTLVNGGCSDDDYEGKKSGDDTFQGASPIAYGETQAHAWCPVGDVDWVSFEAAQGDEVRISTATIGFSSEPVAQLYGTDGNTYIGEARVDGGSGKGEMTWTVPTAGKYYIKLVPQESKIGGVETGYQVGLELKSSIEPPALVCGGVSIPAVLAGALLVSKQVKKRKQKALGLEPDFTRKATKSSWFDELVAGLQALFKKLSSLFKKQR
jgi:murein DD-endopeptidase MepM/ murein hydrolase activator NlpD